MIRILLMFIIFSILQGYSYSLNLPSCVTSASQVRAYLDIDDTKEFEESKKIDVLIVLNIGVKSMSNFVERIKDKDIGIIVFSGALGIGTPLIYKTCPKEVSQIAQRTGKKPFTGNMSDVWASTDTKLASQYVTEAEMYLEFFRSQVKNFDDIYEVSYNGEPFKTEKKKIIIENFSRYTIENIDFTFAILKKLQLVDSKMSVAVMQNRLGQRKAFEILRVNTFFQTILSVPFNPYVHTIIDYMKEVSKIKSFLGKRFEDTLNIRLLREPRTNA